MPKFYGTIGFSVTVQSSASPDIWEPSITERPYYGEIIEESRIWKDAQKVNDDLQINNRISIIGDTYIFENYGMIRYVTLYGTRWKVSNISMNYPRISLSLGGVYNGPTP